MSVCRPWWVSILLSLGLSGCVPNPSAHPRAELPAPPSDADAAIVEGDGGSGTPAAEVIPACRALELCDVECENTRRAWEIQACAGDTTCEQAAAAAYDACYAGCVDLHDPEGDVEAVYGRYRTCLVDYTFGRKHSVNHLRDFQHDAGYFELTDLVCLHENCPEMIAACRGPVPSPGGDLGCSEVHDCMRGCKTECIAEHPGSGYAWIPAPGAEVGNLTAAVDPQIVGRRAGCERACTHACEARARNPQALHNAWAIWGCRANYRTNECDAFERRCADDAPLGDRPPCGDTLQTDPEGTCDAWTQWVRSCFEADAFCGAGEGARLDEVIGLARANCLNNLAERCGGCQLDGCYAALEFLVGVGTYNRNDAPIPFSPAESLGCRPDSAACNQVNPNSPLRPALCAPCTDDGDCGGDRPHCVVDHCQACTLDSCRNDGLACDPVDGCLPCQANAECGDWLCVEGRCQNCTTEGCRERGLLCDPALGCVGCDGDDECDGFICTDGVCKECSLERDVRCTRPEASRCGPGGECGPCVQDGDCLSAGSNQCLDGACAGG